MGPHAYQRAWSWGCRQRGAKRVAMRKHDSWIGAKALRGNLIWRKTVVLVHEGAAAETPFRTGGVMGMCNTPIMCKMVSKWSGQDTKSQIARARCARKLSHTTHTHCTAYLRPPTPHLFQPRAHLKEKAYKKVGVQQEKEAAKVLVPPVGGIEEIQEIHRHLGGDVTCCGRRRLCEVMLRPVLGALLALGALEASPHAHRSRQIGMKATLRG